MPRTQLRIEQRVFVTPTKRKLDVNVVQSNYHIELTPRCAPCCASDVRRTETSSSDVGMYDRTVVTEIIKGIAQTQQVDLASKKRFKGASCRDLGCARLTPRSGRHQRGGSALA